MDNEAYTLDRLLSDIIDSVLIAEKDLIGNCAVLNMDQRLEVIYTLKLFVRVLEDMKERGLY